MGLEHSVFSSGIIISCDSHASKCWFAPPHLVITTSTRLRYIHQSSHTRFPIEFLLIVTGAVHKITPLLDDFICSTVPRQRCSISVEQTEHAEGPESQRLRLSKDQCLKDRDSQRPRLSKTETLKDQDSQRPRLSKTQTLKDPDSQRPRLSEAQTLKDPGSQRPRLSEAQALRGPGSQRLSVSKTFLSPLCL